jgi:hypothetical protein
MCVWLVSVFHSEYLCLYEVPGTRIILVVQFRPQFVHTHTIQQVPDLLRQPRVDFEHAPHVPAGRVSVRCQVPIVAELLEIEDELYVLQQRVASGEEIPVPRLVIVVDVNVVGYAATVNQRECLRVRDFLIPPPVLLSRSSRPILSPMKITL